MPPTCLFPSQVHKMIRPTRDEARNHLQRRHLMNQLSSGSITAPTHPVLPGTPGGKTLLMNASLVCVTLCGTARL